MRAQFCWPLAAMAAAGLFGQSAEPPAFEAASVKPNPGAQGSNTRMGANAGGYTYLDAPLWWIVAEAYGVPFLQVVGPDWIEKQCYDIVARTPPNTSAAQRRSMLQALLAERFHLAAHRDNMVVAALVMTVAKGGPKMHPSDQQPTGYRISQDGAIRHMKVPATMKGLAPMLGGLLHERVVDRTELTGVFDVAVDWDVSLPTESADNLLRAVEGQLGLKLERKKIPLDVVIVDHADKVPTAN